MKRFIVFAVMFILLIGGSSPVLAAKEGPQPILEQGWTVDRIALENKIDIGQLLKQLKIADTSLNRNATLQDLQISEVKAREVIRKVLVIATEEKSKDWRLIFLKFVSWIFVVASAIVLLTRRLITPQRRTLALMAAFVYFGVLLGSDPSPMGTVKDTITLMGAEHTLFPPRLIAFIVFTLMVVVGNKLICGWGCQLGTLQDWLYQLSPVKHKIRLPFAISNSIRIAAFTIFTIVAFAVPLDLIEKIDPFKVFAPSHLTFVSAVFISCLLILSLFLYRPWCTLACPFGLTGWLCERFSWFRVRWNQAVCIQCGACTKACPTEHAAGLLKGAKVKAECYSCAACLSVCPTQALSYDRRNHAACNPEVPHSHKA